MITYDPFQTQHLPGMLSGVTNPINPFQLAQAGALQPYAQQALQANPYAALNPQLQGILQPQGFVGYGIGQQAFGQPGLLQLQNPFAQSPFVQYPYAIAAQNPYAIAAQNPLLAIGLQNPFLAAQLYAAQQQALQQQALQQQALQPFAQTGQPFVQSGVGQIGYGLAPQTWVGPQTTPVGQFAQYLHPLAAQMIAARTMQTPGITPWGGVC